MALFSSKKTTDISSNKIRPTVVRTQNVAKELVTVAKTYGVSVEKLDFNIIEVQTYTRMSNGGKDSDWDEINSNTLDEIDEAALLNPDFQIKQMYEIEIFSKGNKEDLYKDFKLAVGANATKCKVYLSIQKGSQVSYNPRFEKELLILINKRKIRAGMLINIFDGMLARAVSKISAHVRIEEEVIYEKSETILIAESFEPTPTTNDSIILHYDKKEEIGKNEKVDYASRGFIKSVETGELLIEYKKARLGKPGRDCRGEFMKPKDPVVDNKPAFNVDNTIKVEESKLGIKYLANENGYISYKDNKYEIKTEVDVGEISFKTTGSIASELDADVSINVKEANSIKDAIGSGMNVEVNEIHVEGNVGSGATITAVKVIIDGQTHKTSEITAEDIRIHVHKGLAHGGDVHVTRLEHGVIDGEFVEISQALGGKVNCKEVVIDLCASYVKATASRLIEIKKLQGSENIFTIDPLLKKDTKAGVDENKGSIKRLKTAVDTLKKDVDKYTTLIEKNMASFNDVKKRLLHYKKNGVKMPESFVKKYKQFQKTQAHLAVIKKEHDQKSDQLRLLTTRTASFQDNVFDARIINRGKWVGYNELRFKLIDPPMELSFKPQEGSSDKIFAVVEVDEGEFEIKAVKA
ncbi:MAG: flagellar assembly protein A [Campylobacterota bacterium]|nr:flagellar assembly protein A [Campylobacterota bacterium]